MIKELSLRILPEEAANEASLRRVVCRETGEKPETVCAVRVLKRSIDARQHTVWVNVTVRAFIDEEPAEAEFTPVEYRDVSTAKPVVVVGAGPGGLFAALRLIELGLHPIVIERGKDVRRRKIDIARISREHTVNPESNYCFGEGGAGAYSDGKLYTRSKKRGSVDRILRIFCQHGASTAILSDAHPHIGTDKLPRVIENMREQILRCGGEVHFETCMEALLLQADEVKGIRTRDGREFHGPVILATGHSARDVYRYLAARNIPIEAKGIAVGVRLEHPQQLIDRIRYHRKDGRGKYLPAAEYSFVTQAAGRGVYSFCMCPGGFVVPSATSPDEVVVNGMSPSNRGSRWANAGWVVEIRPEDLPDYLCQGMPEGDASLPTRFIRHGLSGTPRTPLPPERWDDPNGSRPAHGRLCTEKELVAPARFVLYTGIACLAASFLDAGVHHDASTRGIPPFRPRVARFSHQRSRTDRGRNAHLLARAYPAKQRHLAARHASRPLPLRRRSRLCRRNRIGSHRRRTLRRTSGRGLWLRPFFFLLPRTQINDNARVPIVRLESCTRKQTH